MSLSGDCSRGAGVLLADGALATALGVLDYLAGWLGLMLGCLWTGFEDARGTLELEKVGTE